MLGRGTSHGAIGTTSNYEDLQNPSFIESMLSLAAAHQHLPRVRHRKRWPQRVSLSSRAE